MVVATTAAVREETHTRSDGPEGEEKSIWFPQVDEGLRQPGQAFFHAIFKGFRVGLPGSKVQYQEKDIL